MVKIQILYITEDYVQYDVVIRQEIIELEVPKSIYEDEIDLECFIYAELEKITKISETIIGLYEINKAFCV